MNADTTAPSDLSAPAAEVAPGRAVPARHTDHAARPPRVARAGLWLLPAYAALLALSTLSHQPSFRSDFPGYARYISTDTFLTSHLGLTIGGAAVGSIGLLSAMAYLATSRAATTAYVGAALTVAANVASSAVFGTAAFAQPAIGRAYLAGQPGVVELNADIYGASLDATAGIGILLFILGGVIFGTAVARTSRRLRWTGIVYALSFVAFLVTGVAAPAGQTLSAAALATVSAAVAWRLPRETFPRAPQGR